MTKQVKVVVTITAEIEQIDGGYLGWKSSVDEHVKHAMDHVTSHMQFGVKEGGLDWRPIKASVRVDRVELFEA